MVVNELITTLAETRSKADQRKLVEQFLMRTPSLPDLQTLVTADVVTFSIDLQYILKQHIRAMEYKKADSESNAHKEQLLFLLGLISNF